MPQAAATTQEPGAFTRLRDVATAPPADLPSETQRLRARRVTTAALLLCVVWAGAAIVVPTTYRDGDAGGGAGFLTAVLVAPAAASLMAYVLSRSRYTLAAAGALTGVAAVGTLVAASYHPELAAPVSALFLFASLLVLGVLFLPLPHAFGLAALNYGASLAIPRWLPAAGPTALEVPYVFLVLNLALFAVLAPLRHRDEEAAFEGARLAAQNATVAQEQTRQASKLAKDAQLKDELLRVASHEVRSPLSVITLQLGLLRNASAQPLTPGQERSLAIIERNIKRANALLETLLDKARLDAGGLVLRPEDVDVAALARETQEAFGAAAAEAGVGIHLEAEPARVRADPLRVSQVLYNLVGNAIKFTPSGGAVRVLVRPAGGGALVHVHDSGAGMDAEQLGKLFQPFGGVREPPNGRKRGTGLGLAISRGLVERHGGRIWAESEGDGHGSTFSFTLPAAPPTESGVPAAPTASATHASGASSPAASAPTPSK